jgi:hypothetical protein
MIGPKRVFTFKITYFKPSGKYYTNTEIEWETTYCNDKVNTPYMYDAVTILKELRDSKLKGVLPGLGKDVVGWYGYVLIDCDPGFPVLILPEEKQ